MKRLLLHLGQHKTGSKALQSFLSHNRSALSARGILYPMGSSPRLGVPAYTISHYLLYGLLKAEIEGVAPAPPCRPFQGLGQFLARLASTPASTIVLSAEDLFEMSTAHELSSPLARVEEAAQALAAACRRHGLGVEAVVYLRRQDHSLAALAALGAFITWREQDSRGYRGRGTSRPTSTFARLWSGR